MTSLTALDRARRKAYWRIVPLVFLSYVIAYIDRSNVAWAKFTMSQDLGFDERTYGWAAGMFFFGYVLLEIPGSLIVERWSARKWISRIMVSWGIVAALTSLVQSDTHFYVARFTLGLAEAGFFPGVIVYLTHWFPNRDRARALSLCVIAQPIAQMIGPPLTAPLLKIGTTETIAGIVTHHPAIAGLVGWQWVYIVWGIPAVLMGIVVFFCMTDRPAQARWLADDERSALESELARERAAAAAVSRGISLWRALRDPRVWLLALANFSVVTAHYGVDLFLPTVIVRWYGLSFAQLSWVVVIPYVALAAGFLLVGWSSDRRRERWFHTAVPMVIGAAALVLAVTLRGSLPLTIALVTIAIVGIRTYLTPFYALPGLFLSGTAMAGGIGLINSIANLGGALGPIAVGTVESMTGRFEGGLFFLVGMTLFSACLILGLRTWHVRAVTAR